TRRRRFARSAHGVGKLLRRSVGVARRRALQNALQLLDLFSLDVREARLDAAHRLRLLALDHLRELSLSPSHPLVQLVQRAATLRPEPLELRPTGGNRLLRRAR